MHSGVESYIGRLERRLRKLPIRIREEHLMEMRSHLADSVGALSAEGRTEDEAVAEALRRIGSDRLIAENLVREHRGLARRSAWRWTWLPALLLLFTAVYPWLMSSSDTPWPDWTRILLWLGWVVVILFFAASWRSRRIVVLPIAAAMIPALVLSVYLFADGPVGVTANSAKARTRIVAGFDRYISNLEAKIADARKVSPAGPLPAAFSHGDVFEGPVIEDIPTYRSSDINPIPVKSGATHVASLHSTPSEAQAKQLWAKSGAAYIAELSRDLDEERGFREQWIHMSGGWPVVMNYLGVSALYDVLIVAFFAAVNLLAIGSVTVRDKVVERLWIAR